MSIQVDIGSILLAGGLRHKITFLYPNIDGVLKARRVEMRGILWDRSQEASEPEWLLQAMCLTEREIRLFSMNDMKVVARG